MRLFPRLFARDPRPSAHTAAANDRPPKTRHLTTERAVDPTQAMLGALTAATDPDQALADAGLSRADLRRLEYDDEIGAALETRREAVLSTPWQLEPAPEDGKAGRLAAERIDDQLRPMMTDLVRAIWEAVPYGYSVIETVWARRDGNLAIDRAVGKPFEWFEPKNDGSLLYRPASGSPVTVDTRFKFLLTRRASTYRQPYGEAMMSRLYTPWFYRREGWRMWARYLERFGAPILAGKIEPPQADGPLSEEDEAAMDEALDRALAELSQALDEAVRSATVATTADISAIGPGNAGEAFQAFASRVDARIQKLVLGQTLTTDVGKSGSYAAANVHDRVRHDKRDADLRLVGATVQRLANAISDLNGWPRVAFDWTLPAELQVERAKRDATLRQAGITGFSDDYLLRAYDFAEGDLEPAQPSTAARPLSAAARGGYRFAAGDEPSTPTGRYTPGQQAVEDLIGTAESRTPEPIDAERIRMAIAAANDPDDLRERLSVLVDQGDPGFDDLVAHSQFAAAVLGYVHAEEGTS